MICVVDYGVGNVQAFLNLFKRLDVVSSRGRNSEDFSNCKGIILPGVGQFDHAMKRLNSSGLRPTLEDLVLEQKIPLLGVCVGMQMLSEGSEEGKMEGLGWIPGRVHDMTKHVKDSELRFPHMGWNSLSPSNNSSLFSKGFESSPQFYFLHSFCFVASDRSDVAATSVYGFEFASAVSRNNIHGIQCHPEKSHHWGQQLLKNFVDNT